MTFSSVLLVSCGALQRPQLAAFPVVLEPGLSNFPMLSPVSSDSLGHDMISDGPESCPVSGFAEDDPLKWRPTRCNELAAPAAPSLFSSPRASALRVTVVPSACETADLVSTPFEVVGQAENPPIKRTFAAFVDRMQTPVYSVQFDDAARENQVACDPVERFEVKGSLPR